MQYEDEKIIAMRNAEKRKQYDSIETGIYVGDELIRFTECRLFDGRMSIMLPDSFTDMAPEDAKKKYPSENRPQIIMTNPDGTVNFTFNLLDQKIAQDQIIDARVQFRMLIQKVFPANEFFEDGVLEINNKSLAWFDFKSPGLDSSIYNLMFVTMLDWKMMIGIYNVPYSASRAWSAIFKLLNNTIIDLTIGR